MLKTIVAPGKWSWMQETIQNMRRFLALGLMFALWNHTETRAQTFGNVTMGGGGYVTGIITCPSQQNLIYA